MFGGIQIEWTVPWILMLAAIAIPKVLSRSGIKNYGVICAVSGLAALGICYTGCMLDNRDREMLDSYKELGLPRSFTQEHLKKTKRDIFLNYHPDRISDQEVKEVALKKFQSMESKLSLLSDNTKRELLDRFNYTAKAASIDDDLLQEIKVNLTLSSLLDVLPANYPWLVGISYSVYSGNPLAAKTFINALIAKAIVELYNCLLKPVQSSDIIDTVLPYLPISERPLLFHGVFCVLFSMLFAKYCIIEKQDPLIEVEVKENRGDSTKRDVWKSIEDMADRISIKILKS